MFTNRFFNSLVIVALAVVAVLLVREAHATAAPVAEMDSATRSYIAWGEALEKAKLNALDSGTRSYIAWGLALQAKNDFGALCR